MPTQVLPIDMLVDIACSSKWPEEPDQIMPRILTCVKLFEKVNVHHGAKSAACYSHLGGHRLSDAIVVKVSQHRCSGHGASQSVLQGRDPTKATLVSGDLSLPKVRLRMDPWV